MIITAEPTRKDHILREAAKLFRALGFKASSMRDLAGAVGIEAAGLYNHISSKQELLETICMTVADRYLTTITEAEANNETLQGRIKSLVKSHIQVMTNDPCLAAVAHDEWRHLDSWAKQDFVRKRNQYESTLKQWIDNGKEAGELRDVDTDIMLFTLLSSLQWLHQWYRKDRSIDSEELEKKMVDLLLNGTLK